MKSVMAGLSSRLYFVFEHIVFQQLVFAQSSIANSSATHSFLTKLWCLSAVCLMLLSLFSGCGWEATTPQVELETAKTPDTKSTVQRPSVPEKQNNSPTSQDVSKKTRDGKTLTVKQSPFTDSQSSLLKEYSQAIQNDPCNVDALVARGCVYLSADQFGSALEDFNRAIYLDPHYLPAFFNRSFLYLEEGKYDLAAQDRTHVLQVNPAWQPWCVSEILTFRFEPLWDLAADDPVLHEQLKRVIQSRIFLSTQQQVEVVIKPNQEVQLWMMGEQQTETQQISNLLSTIGTAELRMLANERDHTAVIQLARESLANEVYTPQGQLVARWVSVAQEQNAKTSTTYQESFNTHSLQAITRIGQAENLEILVMIDPYHLNQTGIQKVSVTRKKKATSQFHVIMNPEGANLLTQLTHSDFPHRWSKHSPFLALLVDGKCMFTTRVPKQLDSEVILKTNRNFNEIKEIAAILTSGALPVRLTFQERFRF